MTLIDKVGIVMAIAIVTVAVGFTATGSSGMPSDIPSAMERISTPLKEAGQEATEITRNKSIWC